MLADSLAENDPRHLLLPIAKLLVQQWADNFVIHVFVSDLRQWGDHLVALDLGSRYGVKTRAPQLESWGVEVAGVIDPAGVLWRIHQIPTSA